MIQGEVAIEVLDGQIDPLADWRDRMVEIGLHPNVIEGYARSYLQTRNQLGRRVSEYDAIVAHSAYCVEIGYLLAEVSPPPAVSAVTQHQQP